MYISFLFKFFLIGNVLIAYTLYHYLWVKKSRSQTTPPLSNITVLKINNFFLRSFLAVEVLFGQQYTKSLMGLESNSFVVIILILLDLFFKNNRHNLLHKTSRGINQRIFEVVETVIIIIYNKVFYPFSLHSFNNDAFFNKRLF
jgi:hypothetical protein